MPNPLDVTLQTQANVLAEQFETTNKQAIARYEQLVKDWAVNADRCSALGVKVPPKPEPPVLVHLNANTWVELLTRFSRVVYEQSMAGIAGGEFDFKAAITQVAYEPPLVSTQPTAPPSNPIGPYMGNGRYAVVTGDDRPNGATFEPVPGMKFKKTITPTPFGPVAYWEAAQ
jgi:hypothetical protein